MQEAGKFTSVIPVQTGIEVLGSSFRHEASPGPRCLPRPDPGFTGARAFQANLNLGTTV